MADAKNVQPGLSIDGGRTTGNNRGLTQAYMLRDLAAKHALELDDAPMSELETRSSRAQALSALLRAWETAVDRIRILRGRPLPGSLRPEKKTLRRGAAPKSLADRLSPLIMPTANPPTQVDPSPEVKPGNSSTPEPIAPENDGPS